MNETCGLAEGLCYGCLDDMNYNLLDECKDCPIYIDNILDGKAGEQE